MLLRGKQNVLDHRHHEDHRRARIEKIWLERPGLVCGLTAALCVLAVVSGCGDGRQITPVGREASGPNRTPLVSR